MVNPPAVAEFYSIQDLKENPLGQVILTDVLPAFCDIVEKITFRAVLQNDKDAVGTVDDLQHGHDIPVGGSLPVQTDFPGLESHLSLIQWCSIGIELAERLHGITDIAVNVDGRVDNSIGACAEDPVQP